MFLLRVSGAYVCSVAKGAGAMSLKQKRLPALQA